MLGSCLKNFFKGGLLKAFMGKYTNWGNENDLFVSNAFFCGRPILVALVIDFPTFTTF